MMSDLEIIHEEKNSWRLLQISGQIDRTNYQEFEQVITQCAENQQAKIRLDFQNLRYINSTGLGLLMATHRHLKKHGGELQIINLNEKLHAIFDLLGWFRYFQRKDDEDEGTAGVPAKL